MPTMSAEELINSALANRVPELVVFVVLVGTLMGWIGFLFIRQQRAQRDVLTQFSQMIAPYAADAEKKDTKFIEAIRHQQVEFIAALDKATTATTTALDRISSRQELSEQKLVNSVERSADKMATVVAENTKALIEVRSLMSRVQATLDNFDSSKRD